MDQCQPEEENGSSDLLLDDHQGLPLGDRLSPFPQGDSNENF